MSLGEGKMLCCMKLGDGTYYSGVGLKLPETWSADNAALLKDAPALRTHLVEEYYASWPQLHTDLIRHSDGNFHSWPLYAMPTDSLCWKTVPGVALIGDAAHVT